MFTPWVALKDSVAFEVSSDFEELSLFYKDRRFCFFFLNNDNILYWMFVKDIYDCCTVETDNYNTPSSFVSPLSPIIEKSL